ncbi:MAG: D-alanine--D-alanine ligase [Thiotrichales bacterium]|jgi:D-alanine-D-alanine ligase|nr:D-alanine--D-alanine ligase [Thiotrichales bacterium]|tara:strand:+ start:18914 stop:19792 length:879 start_codon:yes stop_codon:yes gene_type:complete
MIAVLMGGYSAEREISLLSGKAVYDAFCKSKVDCFAFDLTQDNLDELWSKEFDKAFIVLHGRGGEDGFIQSQLEKNNISYTGSDAKSSSLCMDKAVTKDLWSKHNLPLAASIVATKGENLDSITFPLPWAVKPTLEGSSIGITKVTHESELDSALKTAFIYGNQALVEQWIDGDEYTVSILNDDALPSIKIISDHDIYDYHSKYFSNKTEYLCPSDLSKDQELNLQKIALKAFNLTGASGWGRVDFILDKDRVPFLLEINTVPGMTSHSLVPMAAKALNISFEELVIKILNG